MDGSNSASLFLIFIENFNVSDIYAIGWEAARAWMSVVSGVIIAIAIGIRSIEENVNLLAGKQSGFLNMAVNVGVVTFCIGLYFTIAWVVISLFNALYGILSNSPMIGLSAELETTLSKLMDKEADFAWHDVADTFLSVCAFVAYWLTHLILIFVTLAMRIGHAVLVSLCLFWGAVALPMSITTGLKSLSAFKNICIFALIWPIIESFFMFAIGGTFEKMLTSSSLDVDSFDTWNMGLMVFYLSAFAIINLMLVAAMISAPFVAQGLANGSGNVSGMIGSFAAAGIAAGAVAARTTMPKSVLNGAKAKSVGAFGSLGKALGSTPVGQSVSKVANADVGKGISSAINSLTPTPQPSKAETLGSGVGLSKPGAAPSSSSRSSGGDSATKSSSTMGYGVSPQPVEKPKPSFGVTSASSSAHTTSPGTGVPSNPSKGRTVADANKQAGKSTSGTQSTSSKQAASEPVTKNTTGSASSSQSSQVNSAGTQGSDTSNATHAKTSNNNIPVSGSVNQSTSASQSNGNKGGQTQSDVPVSSSVSQTTLSSQNNGDNEGQPESNIPVSGSANQSTPTSQNNDNSDGQIKKASKAAVASSLTGQGVAQAVDDSKLSNSSEESTDTKTPEQKASEARKKRAGYFANKARSNTPKSKKASSKKRDVNTPPKKPV